MSSRQDYRRRDRSWEKDDRERERDRNRDRYSRGGRGDYRSGGRRSRSRSPRRDRERREAPERRDYGKDREDDRRDRVRRDTRRRDDGREADRNDKKDVPRGGNEREKNSHRVQRPQEVDNRGRGEDKDSQNQSRQGDTQASRPNLDPDAPEPGETGDEMDTENPDDAMMMTTMGLAGFGSTKGKKVEGNQDGSSDVKKIRTWRQYMNRRGGFNRPLDKIK